MANHTTGRPHLVGNKGRKGLPKPKGSGRARIFKDPVPLTIVVERETRDYWRSEANAFGITMGEYIRHFTGGGSNG
jgi:hypothetical protein